MPINLQFVLAMSCALPAIAALIQFKKAEKKYYPFLLLLWLAVITELVSDIPMLLYQDYTIADIAYPLYNIAEVVLMLIFFKRNDIQIPWWLITITGCIGIISLIITNFSEKILVFDYVRVVFFALILVQSIRLLSSQVFIINVKPGKNSLMIIAFGCVLYYSYFLLVSMFTNLNNIIALHGIIFSVHQIVNAITYIIFTWAILCIPRKVKY